MSIPLKPTSAKLIIGIFLKKTDLVDSIGKDLVDKFGPIDIVSKWFAFDFTSYYKKEMGKPLFRRIFTFKNLVEQYDLSDIKLFTNEIEKKYSLNDKRVVNIDPGILLKERFVLATGKNFTHRIYINNGIYADLTLIFQKGGFKTLPWTYPDYADKKMVTFLEKVREKYSMDLKLMELIND